MRTGLPLVAASGLVGVLLLGRTLVPDAAEVPDLGDPVVLETPAASETGMPTPRRTAGNDGSRDPDRPGSTGNGATGSPAVPTDTALPRSEAAPDRVPVPVCSVRKDNDEKHSDDRGGDEGGCGDEQGDDKKAEEERKKAEKKAEEERKKAEKKAEEEQKKAEEEQKKAEKKAEEERKKTGRSEGSPVR